jgi:cell division inhibitor SepF
MGTWRKAGVWLGLVEDDEERDYVDDDLDAFDEDFEPPARPRGRATVHSSAHSPAPSAARSERVPDRYPDRTERPADRMAHSVTDRSSVRSFARAEPAYASEDNLALAPQVIHPPVTPPVVASPEEPPYRITTMHPTTYNEARTIGEHFRDHIPVIMNLTEMTEADARRLVDFCAGLTFGLRGSIDRVTNRVFLLSPADVEVTAEDKAKIAEGGFFNQS